MAAARRGPFDSNSIAYVGERYGAPPAAVDLSHVPAARMLLLLVPFHCFWAVKEFDWFVVGSGGGGVYLNLGRTRSTRRSFSLKKDRK